MTNRPGGYFPKSKTDKWGTPPDFYKELDKEFNFNYDPCPIDWEPDTHEDGLLTEWGTRTFCNPPYSKTLKFIKKAHEEWKKGKLIVMLLNNNTENQAFHEYIYHQAEVRLLKGRLRFVDYSDPQHPITNRPSPRGSMLIIFK